jgi:hypothetical protein
LLGKESIVPDSFYEYPQSEPVPPATQLAIMPFLAALSGSLACDGDATTLRVTIHRTMSREGKGYFQQVCGYFPIRDPSTWGDKAGRILPVTAGIIGKAYADRRIWRTKHYSSDAALLRDLKKSMSETGEPGKPEDVPKSYVAIPFLGPRHKVVLILFADCFELNFFADDTRIRQIASMCTGFCRLFDALQNSPFPNLRNFSLQTGQPAKETPTVYKWLQEAVDFVDPPEFKSVSSFNYEGSVA